MTDKSVDILRAEVQYAERLSQRAARLYRRVQTAGTFLAVLGGSGTLSALTHWAPPWLPIAGGVLLAVVGAALVAVRPADKAAANEADMRRFTALLVSSQHMGADDLEQALNVARQSCAPEIEPLRNVVYNDVVRAIGQPGHAQPLTRAERVIAALA
jgi:Mg2+/citrate symporter